MLGNFNVQRDVAAVRRQFADKRKQIDLAAARAINRTLTTVRSVATKEVVKRTGITPQRAVRDRLHIRKATPNYLIGEIGVERYTPNLARFAARQTKRGVSATAWGKRKVYPRTFLGNQGRTVFKRVGKSRVPIRPVWGPRMHRAFVEREVTRAMDAVARDRFRVEFRRELKVRGVT